MCFISDSLITYGIQNRVLREAWGWAEGLSVPGCPFAWAWPSQAVFIPLGCGYKSAPLAHVLISSDQQNERRELSVQAVRRRWASSHLGLFVGFSVLPLGHCSLGDGVGAGTGLNIEDPDS